MKKSLFAFALVMAAAVMFAAETKSANKRSAAGKGGAKHKIVTVEEWHAAHEAGDFRELFYLVDSGKNVQTARAELGDAGLFRRYTELLTRYFSKYSPGVVSTALLHMEKLLPAVDPVRAMVNLTYINSRIKLVSEKEPERWAGARKRMEKMLKSIEK